MKDVRRTITHFSNVFFIFIFRLVKEKFKKMCNTEAEFKLNFIFSSSEAIRMVFEKKYFISCTNPSPVWIS